MTVNRTESFRLKMLLLTVSLTFGSVLYGQNVSVTAELDSTLLFIGGQMNFRVGVIQPNGLDVAIPVFTDTITKNIEVVHRAQPDTVRNGDMLNISQLYRITSFDSGLHYIPPVEVEYLMDTMVEKRESQSLGLMVINPFTEVDPQKGVFDIKQPLTLPFSLLEIVRTANWVLLAMLVLSLLVLGIHWWRKKRNPLKEILFREKPKEPPHIIALRELDRIKSEKIWQKGQIKQFYSQLTDTLRTYMEERFGFSAMEQTTPEILQALKAIELTDEKLRSRITQILETADLAKFAKYEPLPDENDNSMSGAYLFVNQTMPVEQTQPDEAAHALPQQENNQNTNV